MNSAAREHLMLHIAGERSSIVGFFGLALGFFFNFSFFHVDKAVFNVL